jgi:hypothetical protein
MFSDPDCFQDFYPLDAKGIEELKKIAQAHDSA